MVGITAATTHDSVMLVPLLDGIPAIRTRRDPRWRWPAKLHADKGYDAEDLRTECRQRGIAPRIARRGIESSERLGAGRRKIECSISWIFGYWRLTMRQERGATSPRSWRSPPRPHASSD